MMSIFLSESETREWPTKAAAYKLSAQLLAAMKGCRYAAIYGSDDKWLATVEVVK